jgi:hypothetical protein
MGVVMADKKGLQIIGFILGAVTVAVMSIAAIGIVNASDFGPGDARPVVAISAAASAR